MNEKAFEFQMVRLVQNEGMLLWESGFDPLALV